MTIIVVMLIVGAIAGLVVGIQRSNASSSDTRTPRTRNELRVTVETKRPEYPRERRSPARPRTRPPFSLVPSTSETRPSSEDPQVLVWRKGLWLRDQRQKGVKYSDVCREHGAIVFSAAGVTYQHEDLQRNAFGPGRTVELRLDPANPADPEAVGIYSADGRYRCGYVPADLAPEVRRRLDSLSAIVYWQYRQDSGRGQRVGVRILAWNPELLVIHPPR